MKLQFVNELLTGVEEMDRQHMVLVELLNEVTSLLERGEREKAIKVFRDKLVEYVETHLKDEEEFMEKIGYPDLDNHRKGSRYLQKSHL
ncbi:bacteriohemerythrin [Thermocrinis albus]|uniref:bacteriohemerythrin n=1 Tax=Thermocrinis albus TaxID=136094 RepID=UPI0002F6E0F9|nr:hemerythrin domain-containing protein [Thermocrinis albus]